MKTRAAAGQRGFTIVELMTVITILAVLAMAAAPGMQSLIASARARAAANDLIADLVLARSEAIKRNREVELSPAGGWTAGWMIRTVTTAELIGRRNPLGNEVKITRSPDSVTYDASGRLSGTTSTVRFELFDGNNTYRCITLDPSGQPSTKTRACP